MSVRCFFSSSRFIKDITSVSIAGFPASSPGYALEIKRTLISLVRGLNGDLISFLLLAYKIFFIIPNFLFKIFLWGFRLI